MKSLWTFLVAVSLIGCGNDQTTKIEREGDPAIYSVTDTDLEMNEAIRTANQTLGTFNNALKSGNPDFSSFSLKVRFDTPNGGEHIWLSEIILKDTRYFGVVNNQPESTTEVKFGDTIQVVNGNISDWMYIDDQKLRGGYTIKLLRKRMTEAARNQFDSENGLIIED